MQAILMTKRAARPGTRADHRSVNPGASRASFLALLLSVTPAAPVLAEDDAGSAEGMAGFGLGAVLGAVVAGPPGALLGALGGSLAGDGWHSREAKLDASEAERAALAQELAALRRSGEPAGGRRACISTAA